MRGLSNLRKLSLFRDESGAVAIITALGLVVFLGMVALVVDVGHLKAVHNELQNAADAAALAGTRALFFEEGEVAKIVPLPDPPYCDQGINTAINTINRTDQQWITILRSEVVTGHWGWPGEEDKWPVNTFTPLPPCSIDINSLRVTTRKDATVNQPVNTWFARVFGINQVDVATQAVAAVGSIGGYSPGPFPPMWIPTEKWKTIVDGAKVKAYPDPGDLFAWAAPVPESANASYLKDAINGDLGSAQMPQIGATANLSNGLLGSIHMLISKMINKESYSYTYFDETLGQTVTITGWLTAVMVGDRTEGSDPTKMVQQGTIDQIVPILITAVDKPSAANGNQWAINFTKLPEKYIMIGSPTGPKKGPLYATQPRLVQ